MSHDLYTYLQNMHTFIQSQEQRIRNLEKTIKAMQKEIQNFKSKPPVHVGTIEYKFDQLKVETLEGTLNIGLNPSDLQGIDEFSVGKQNIRSPLPAKEEMETVIGIETTIYQYLESDLPQVIKNCQEELGLPADDSYTSFIKEDIKKQLPGKIDQYLKQNIHRDINDSPDQLQTEIIEELKKNIQSGVRTFLSNLPNYRKE